MKFKKGDVVSIEGLWTVERAFDEGCIISVGNAGAVFLENRFLSLAPLPENEMKKRMKE